MQREKLILLVAVLALAALWWAYARGKAAAEAEVAGDAMAGFWEAPADFCVDAGLTSMHVMLGPPRDDGKRLAYVAATNASGDAVADDFAMVAPQAGRAEGKGWVRFRAGFKSEGGGGLFPATVSLLVNARRGQMRVHGGKRVWAVLEKDAAASQAIGG